MYRYEFRSGSLHLHFVGEAGNLDWVEICESALDQWDEEEPDDLADLIEGLSGLTCTTLANSYSLVD